MWLSEGCVSSGAWVLQVRTSAFQNGTPKTAPNPNPPQENTQVRIHHFLCQPPFVSEEGPRGGRLAMPHFLLTARPPFMSGNFLQPGRNPSSMEMKGSETSDCFRKLPYNKSAHCIFSPRLRTLPQTYAAGKKASTMQNVTGAVVDIRATRFTISRIHTRKPSPTSKS